jgi:hypothetical protein
LITDVRNCKLLKGTTSVTVNNEKERKRITDDQGGGHGMSRSFINHNINLLLSGMTR